MGELYDRLRSLSKPLVIALNGLAAGSAFQVALLGDMRVGHPGVTMGQPEINSGIASVTGPWIMREMLGLARTVDLTLTGRMMAADECHAIGLINRLVPENEVRPAAMALAAELAEKPPVAMRLEQGALPGGDRGRLSRMHRGRDPQPARGVRHRRAGQDDASVPCQARRTQGLIASTDRRVAPALTATRVLHPPPGTCHADPPGRKASEEDRP